MLMATHSVIASTFTLPVATLEITAGRASGIADDARAIRERRDDAEAGDLGRLRIVLEALVDQSQLQRRPFGNRSEFADVGFTLRIGDELNFGVIMPQPSRRHRDSEVGILWESHCGFACGSL